MNKNEYGSVDYFKELFSDVIANIEEPIDTTDVILAFEKAIEEWRDYHAAQMHRYETMLSRYRQRRAPIFTDPIPSHF